MLIKSSWTWFLRGLSQQLDKIEIELDNLIKNQNKRFYHKIADYFYNGFEVVFITMYSLVRRLF